MRELLEAMVAEVEADEPMVQDLIGEPADRLTSYRLIAEVFDLRGRGPYAGRIAGCPSGADAHVG